MKKQRSCSGSARFDSGSFDPKPALIISAGFLLVSMIYLFTRGRTYGYYMYLMPGKCLPVSLFVFLFLFFQCYSGFAAGFLLCKKDCVYISERIISLVIFFALPVLSIIWYSLLFVGFSPFSSVIAALLILACIITAALVNFRKRNLIFLMAILPALWYLYCLRLSFCILIIN